MKKTILTMIGLATMFAASAQQKEGKVIYSRTTQMQVQIADGNEAMERAMPRSRTEKFELTYGNNKSLWQRLDEEMSSDEAVGNGMQFRMVIMGANDIVFHDFTNASRTDQREFFDKKIPGIGYHRKAELETYRPDKKHPRLSDAAGRSATRRHAHTDQHGEWQNRKKGSS